MFARRSHFALAHLPNERAENFRLAAKQVKNGKLRSAVVKTLEAIPAGERPTDAARNVITQLVTLAEKTPAARRTTPDFLDAMQLADELLAALPVDEARGFRKRLEEIVVRVVRINTVEEEMRYDTPYFAVEAGRPVQLVLRNEDLMQHNLVITKTGAMREVAELAAEMPVVPDRQGRIYVPKSRDVLFATKMVEPHRQEVLTFNAPKEPGEYPYVCTFPRHWMRMYGVMVVVEDLEAWRANPKKPADPIGQNRDFVKAWTVDDLKEDLENKLRGRSSEIGKRLFVEATCEQCHKLDGKGGAVGPQLDDVLTRWEGDKEGILREILDPSHKVDPKFALYNVLTLDGQVISGIVVKQDRDSVTIVSNPEKPEPRVVRTADIDEMVKTSSSLMPKGLLDRFSEDEIFELLAYIAAVRKTSPDKAK